MLLPQERSSLLHRLIHGAIRLIDSDQGIVRGSIGQSIEAILSNINKIEIYLIEIIYDINIELETKELASTVLAYYQGVKSIKTIEKLAPESEIITEVIAFLKKYKSFNFYQ